MTNKEFKKLCKETFLIKGFKKNKNMYYRKGKDLICGIELQKSNYSPAYYINYYFFIYDEINDEEYPPYYKFDIQGRLSISSKDLHNKNVSHTALIEYEKYTLSEILIFFDEEFKNIIFPPLQYGKEYILTNLNVLYFMTLRKDEVIKKLQS